MFISKNLHRAIKDEIKYHKKYWKSNVYTALINTGLNLTYFMASFRIPGYKRLYYNWARDLTPEITPEWAVFLVESWYKSRGLELPGKTKETA